MSLAIDLSFEDKSAIERIRDEFGTLWGADDKERTRRQLAILRYMRRLPPVDDYGTEYTQPYSLGLHLAALRHERGPTLPHERRRADLD